MQLLGRARVGFRLPHPVLSRNRDSASATGVLHPPRNYVLETCTIADGAQIRPFAHLRPGSEIGENAHVGDFLETKKAKLGRRSKDQPTSLLWATRGDRRRPNIGAGTILCNYDGVDENVDAHRRRPVLGGSDTTLVAPITVAIELASAQAIPSPKNDRERTRYQGGQAGQRGGLGQRGAAPRRPPTRDDAAQIFPCPIHRAASFAQ